MSALQQTGQSTQPTLVLDKSLTAFRNSLRRFLEKSAAEAAVRSATESESGYDGALWGRLNDEFALAGLTVPESLGGSGFGLHDAIPAFEELGRALAPSPFFATAVLAVNALLPTVSGAEADPVAAELLQGIAAGSLRVAVAWAEPGTRAAGVGLTVGGVSADGEGRLRGEKLGVIDGAVAETLLVFAADPDGGVSLFAVSADDPAVSVTPQRVLDLTRRQARVQFSGAVGRRVGSAGQGVELFGAMLDHAVAALCVESVGAAQKLFDLSLDYAREREQFGQVIGSFQGLKFQLADQYGLLEKARVMAYNAAWCADHRPGQLPHAASAAKSLCGTACSRVAAETLHVFGGMGFTWDHPGQLYFKRLRSSEALLGTPTEHRRRLRALGASAPLED